MGFSPWQGSCCVLGVDSSFFTITVPLSTQDADVRLSGPTFKPWLGSLFSQCLFPPMSEGKCCYKCCCNVVLLERTSMANGEVPIKNQLVTCQVF